MNMLRVVLYLVTFEAIAFSFRSPLAYSQHRLVRKALSASVSSYLESLINRKRVEVENLLRRHDRDDDPVKLRLNYAAAVNTFNLTNSIRKDGFGPNNLHRMSIIVDVKRRSPTVPSHQDIVYFEDAAQYVELLTKVNVDAFFISTDSDYGGDFDDLKSCSRRVREVKPVLPPAIIHKDIIFHPIQVRM